MLSAIFVRGVGGPYFATPEVYDNYMYMHEKFKRKKVSLIIILHVQATLIPVLKGH